MQSLLRRLEDESNGLLDRVGFDSECLTVAGNKGLSVHLIHGEPNEVDLHERCLFKRNNLDQRFALFNDNGNVHVGLDLFLLEFLFGFLLLGFFLFGLGLRLRNRRWVFGVNFDLPFLFVLLAVAFALRLGFGFRVEARDAVERQILRDRTSGSFQTLNVNLVFGRLGLLGELLEVLGRAQRAVFLGREPLAALLTLATHLGVEAIAVVVADGAGDSVANLRVLVTHAGTLPEVLVSILVILANDGEAPLADGKFAFLDLLGTADKAIGGCIDVLQLAPGSRALASLFDLAFVAVATNGVTVLGVLKALGNQANFVFTAVLEAVETEGVAFAVLRDSGECLALSAVGIDELAHLRRDVKAAFGRRAPLLLLLEALVLVLVFAHG